MKELVLNTGKTLQIRHPLGNDSEHMLEFVKIVGGESNNLTFGAEGISMTIEQEATFLDGLAASATSTMLIGEIDGEIVASGSLMSSPRERMKHHAMLGISVKKAYWRQGIGQAILLELFSEAIRKGLEIIYLEVLSENTGAIALYEKLGFIACGRYPNKMKVDGVCHTTILMYKELT